MDHAGNDGRLPVPASGSAIETRRESSGSRTLPSPPATLGGAIARHPWLVVIPALVLAGAAIAVGLSRAPQFTAETRLSVGRLDVPTQAIPGVVSANQSLAATYSRLVKAEGVIEPVAARVGLTPAQVNSALSASPIPESPIIRLEAKATSEALSMKLANLSAVVLTRYVESLNQTSDEDELLQQYRGAASDLAAAQLARDAAQRAEAESSSEEARQLLADATADFEVANLQFATLKERISQDAQGRVSADPITTVNTASEAVSDANTVLRRLVAVGVIAGLVFGVLLALLRERFKRRAALG